MLDSPEAQFAIEAVREASLLARRIQREMVTGALTKDDRSPVTVADFAVQAWLLGDSPRACRAATLIGEEHADALRLEEGIATLDQITDFVRSAIPDATPEEVCGLIDRGSGEPPSNILDARSDRRHQGLLAPRAVRRCAGVRSRWQSRTGSSRLSGTCTAAQLSQPLAAKARGRNRSTASQSWRSPEAFQATESQRLPAFFVPSKNLTRTSTKSASSRPSSA